MRAHPYIRIRPSHVTHPNSVISTLATVPTPPQLLLLTFTTFSGNARACLRLPLTLVYVGRCTKKKKITFTHPPFPSSRSRIDLIRLLWVLFTHTLW